MGTVTKVSVTNFYPDGVGQNPLDFYPFHHVRFNDEICEMKEAIMHSFKF